MVLFFVFARLGSLRFSEAGGAAERQSKKDCAVCRLRLSRQASVELARLAKMCGLVERCRVEKAFVGLLAQVVTPYHGSPITGALSRTAHFFGGGAGRMHVGRESRSITPELYQRYHHGKFCIGDII